MPFLRNGFLKIFEDLFTITLFSKMKIIYNFELKIKARDLNLTLVTFWILLAVKCPLENYSKPYGSATAMPPAWGLKIEMVSKNF